MIESTQFQDIDGCLEISNRTVSVIVSTGFGPRILAYSLDGGENILGWHPGAAVETELGTWKPYGGHRLWLAPENMPVSYSPDNEPVEVVHNGEYSLTLVQPDVKAALEKRMTVTLDDTGSGITIDHKITNTGDADMTASAWALTIMRPGGVAIVPNEKAEAYGADTLLPVRTMALWSYTDFTDPRWHFGTDDIRVRVDEGLGHPQKFGVLNRQGWAAYECSGLRFTKSFDVSSGPHPDMNSNCEIYTAGGFCEVETLSPLKKLAPGEAIDHQERWTLETI